MATKSTKLPKSPPTLKRENSIDPGFCISITTPDGKTGNRPPNQRETFPWTNIVRPTVGDAHERPEYVMYGNFVSRTNKWFCLMLYVCFFSMVVFIATLICYFVTRDGHLIPFMAASGFGSGMWIVSLRCSWYVFNKHFTHLEEFVNTSARSGRKSLSTSSSMTHVENGTGGAGGSHNRQNSFQLDGQNVVSGETSM